MTIEPEVLRPILFSEQMVRALLDGSKTQTRRVIKPQSLVQHYGGNARTRCPHGKPGDGLWVREAFRTSPEYDNLPPRLLPLTAHLLYEADDDQKKVNRAFWGRYRSARFMPRWASRIALKLTDVRVERVQEISYEDVRTEGIKMPGDQLFPTQNTESKLTREFQKLWDSLNGKKTGCSWSDNPWVWVLTFNVHKINVDDFLEGCGGSDATIPT